MRKKVWYKKNSEKVKNKQRNYHTENKEEINKKRRLGYDPDSRKDNYDSEKQKESYDPAKRRAAYEDEKKDQQNGIFKDFHAIRKDRKYCSINARRDNVFRMTRAMAYVKNCCSRLEVQKLKKEIHGHLTQYCPKSVKDIFEYIDEVKNKSLPKEVIETMTKIYKNFLELYKTVEKEIEEMANESASIKLLDHLEQFYKERDNSHWKKWESVVEVAESAIVKFSDEIEIQNYYGSDGLKRPKVKSCRDRKEKCIECLEKNALREEADKKKGEVPLGHYDPLDMANLSEDFDNSPTKIQKPYSFTRGKINFTLEDLENSSGADDDYSPDLPSSSGTMKKRQK